MVRDRLLLAAASPMNRGVRTSALALVALLSLALLLVTPAMPRVSADGPTAAGADVAAAYPEPVVPSAPPRYAGDEPVTLTVLHINDFHATFTPVPLAHADDDEDSEQPPAKAGGLARVAGVVTARRAANEGRSVLLIAGDQFTGHRVDALSENRASMLGLNALAPDAFVLGNHELDVSAEHCLDLFSGRLAEAEDAPDLVPQFPWLCANLRYGDRPVALPYCWLDPARTGGLRVAVIGLITPDLFRVTRPSGLEGVTLTDTVDATRDALDAIDDAGGADVTIVLSHCGLDHDRALADKRGIRGRVDLIVAGHDHQVLARGEALGRDGGLPLLVEAGANGSHVGEVTLTFDPDEREVTHAEATLIGTGPDCPYDDDDDAAALVDRLLDRDAELGATVIGEAKRALVARPSGAESNLGSFEAAAFVVSAREAGHDAQVGLQNLGGLRGDFGKGEVTVDDVWRVAPFGNEVVVVTLTGEEIRDAIEGELTRGRPLQLAGLRVEYCPLLAAGKRVQQVSLVDLDGKRLRGEDGPVPLDDDGLYTVATNNYAIEQAEKYLAVDAERAAELLDGQTLTGVLDRDAIRAAFEAEPDGIEGRYRKAYVLVPASLDELDEVETLTLGEFRYTFTIDGDTIVVYGLSRSLRLMGVDTEETFRNNYPSGFTEERCRREAAGDMTAYSLAVRTAGGAAAFRPAKACTPMGEVAKGFAIDYFLSARNENGGYVRLELDSARRALGYYNRWLVHVLVWRDADGDGEPEWDNFNEALVREGLSPYSMKYGYLDHPGYHDRFELAMADAREAEVGVWDPAPARDQRHYLDYDERLLWWRLRADQLRWYDREYGDGSDRRAPLRLGDGSAVERLESARPGRELTVFGAPFGPRFDEGTFALSHYSRANVTVRLDDGVALGDLWEPTLDGEFVTVTGTLGEPDDDSDGGGYTITLEAADNLARAPDGWPEVDPFDLAALTELANADDVSRVKISGTVNGIAQSRGGGALYLELDDPDDDGPWRRHVSITLLGQNYWAFGSREADDVRAILKERFEGRTVTIYGELSLYEDAPQLRLYGPGQVRVHLDR